MKKVVDWGLEGFGGSGGRKVVEWESVPKKVDEWWRVYWWRNG